jgi:hypothetical protein
MSFNRVMTAHKNNMLVLTWRCRTSHAQKGMISRTITSNASYSWAYLRRALRSPALSKVWACACLRPQHTDLLSVGLQRRPYRLLSRVATFWPVQRTAPAKQLLFASLASRRLTRRTKTSRFVLLDQCDRLRHLIRRFPRRL